MSQCNIIKIGYCVDAETLELFESRHCIKPYSHSGSHMFFKNSTTFHKTIGGAVTEQLAMIRKRKKMFKMISTNERKRTL